MKKLIILLLFIPLVSFGQTNLGKTRNYLINKCEKEIDCKIIESTTSLVLFKYGDAFNTADGQTVKHRLDIDGYVESELLTIHNTDWKSMAYFDMLLKKSQNWEKFIDINEFLESENFIIKFNNKFLPKMKARITYYKLSKETTIEYTYGRFEKKNN